MSKLIRTLSLEGYLKSQQKDGYAVAICCSAPLSVPCEIVAQAFAESEYYPKDARVNIRTGEFTAPTSMRGMTTATHSGQLAEDGVEYRVMRIPEFNAFIRTLKS